MRPRGRPPSTRQVLSFEAAETPLPDEVLLDTSFVVEALLVSQPLHAAAVDFLVRLATEDVRIRFSSMLELELAETAFQIALKENHPRDWKRFRHDGRVRRRASRLMSGVEEAWASVLAYVDYARIDVDEVIEEVPRLMRTYGLASYDAVHAATALRGDPVGIVTTDLGFCTAAGEHDNLHRLHSGRSLPRTSSATSLTCTSWFAQCQLWAELGSAQTRYCWRLSV